MTLKELTGVAEVIRGLNFSEGILGVSIMEPQFPKIQLTEEEYCIHFGRTVTEPHSPGYDKMVTIWGGCEFFCLVLAK